MVCSYCQISWIQYYVGRYYTKPGYQFLLQIQLEETL